VKGGERWSSSDVRWKTVPQTSGLDLRVAAIKSTWPLQVESSHFSSKSPPKFSTQVAAEF